MDELDRSILDIVQKDGRIPFTTVAKMLSVTEGTVRNRVAKLVEDQVVQFVGLLNPHRLGYEASAIICVSIQAPHLDETAARLAEFPEVSYLIMVAGEFDLMVEVFCRDQADLGALLKDKIQQLPGVQRTQTFVILHTFKMAQGGQPILTRYAPIKATS
jgi:Lrp/AsnC family transcriptional regulator for asnA, asnC and gidA